MTSVKTYARIREIFADWNRRDELFRGRLKSAWIPAALALTCLSLILLAGCKSGGATITIQLLPTTTPSVDEGQPFNFTATLANDTSNKGVTWSINQSGCSGNGCGSLTNPTPFSVTYVAPTGLSATESVTLTATSNTNSKSSTTATISVVLSPTFTTTSLPAAANGVPYNQTIVVANGVTPLTFSLTSGTIPAGLKLNPSGTIVGTPSVPVAGQNTITVPLTVAVTDSGTPPLTVSQAFSLMVTPPPLLSITTSSLPTGSINANYNAPVTATGGVVPYTWSVKTGSLPPGLVLGPTTGQISGVPTTQGTFSFTVQTQDSSLPAPGQTGQAALSITIQQQPPLAISTTSLPLGATATPYSTSLLATGGIPPYAWTVSTGQLPPGLALAPNGTISGTPILVTTTPDQFTVKVTDSGVTPSTATQPLTITIASGTTSSNALLNGQYAFLFKGFDSGGPVSIAGSFIADGNGNITIGQEDINRTSGVVTLASLTGKYLLGNDGRGTMELVAKNPSTSVTLTTDYQLALDSNGNARFIENNTTSTTTDTLGTHGQGTLKFVPGTSASTTTTPSTAIFTSGFTSASLNGNYAFEFSGQDMSSKPTALAGVVNANGNGTLSSGGQINSDFNDAGAYSAQSLGGTFSVGSTFNRGVAQITFAAPSKSAVQLTFAFYFISPTDLYFVEIDTTPTTVFYTLSGEMIFQPPANSFQSTSLSGVSVTAGVGLNASNASVFVGLLTSNGSGNATLAYDENSGGVITTPTPVFAGTYSVANNGRTAFTGLGASAAATRVAVAYLTGTGQGFLLGSDAAVTTGRLEQQTGGPSFTSSSFQGNYALGSAPPSENKVPGVVGQVYATGGGTLTGTVDEIDAAGTAHLGQSLVANVNALTSNGRGVLAPNSITGFPALLVFYLVSPGSVRAIPADATAPPSVFLFDH